MSALRSLACALALSLGATALPVDTFAADYNIDSSHMNMGFKVRHLGISWVHGRFHQVEGTVNFDENNIEGTSANITIAIDSIDTENEDRDGHLKNEDFFDAANHPNMTFTSTGVRNVGEDGSFELVGNLSMRGTTQEVVLTVPGISAEMAHPMYPILVRGVSASGTVQRADYGIHAGMADMAIGQEVHIQLDFELVRPNPDAS